MIRIGLKLASALRSRAARASWRIVGLYLLLAGLWILFSDKVVEAVAFSPEQAHHLQTLKGFAFVVATAGALLGLCYRRFASIYAAKRRLYESKRRYKHLLSNLPGMAYRRRCSSPCMMQFVSEGAMDVTGYAAGRIQAGEVCYEQLIHPDDRANVASQIERAIAQREPYCMEYRLQTAGGAMRWVWERGRAVYSRRGRAVALEGLVLDVTDRWRADRLEAQRQQFLKQAQDRDQALSIVGHELKTPLAALRAISELLITDAIDHDQELKLLQGLNQQSMRMSDLINDMLETARLASGRTSWHWSRLRLADVCRDAVEIVRPLVDASAVTLQVQVLPPDLAMNGDEGSLRRVLVNLLSNAARYTPRGVIEISARPDVEGRRPAVVVEVRDTGRGISQASLDKLGIPFALSSSRSNSDRGGTGLGLAICRQIVAVHGGQMRVTSNPGAGATFAITLPADLSEPQVNAEPCEILVASPGARMAPLAG
jgi:PAS domain S-box-containing protein